MDLYANRYEIIRDLGRGGNGRVLLVKDHQTDLMCALKILSSILSTDPRKIRESIGSFQHEFDTLKGLNHPYIAKVYDAGFEVHSDDHDKERKEFYISTEFIEGQQLIEACQNQTYQVIESLFIQSLRALSYIHNKQIFHFDIKPPNLLVCENNGKLEIRLIDFGFANYYDRFKKNTEVPWVIAGSAPYVPPEILKHIIPDQRADFYSLACTFYYAFTGRLPFSAMSEGEFYDKHLNEIPQSPSFINKNIPDYMSTILLRLLEKESEKRYATAKEIIEEINFYSETPYPIDTLETRASYIPEIGKMVGRNEEFKKFRDFCDSRFVGSSSKKPPYLIVQGPKGSGKTRFLTECKNEAQKYFIKTMSWTEFMSYPPNIEMPRPCLVLGDEVDIPTDPAVWITPFDKEEPILAIFTSCDDHLIFDEDCIVRLKYFNKKQVRELIVQSSGLEEVPDFIVNGLYEITEGKPHYLVESLRYFFKKGFLRDAKGTWSAQMVEDLKEEFKSLGAPQFIEQQLREEIRSLPLDEKHREVLGVLALYDTASIDELKQILNLESLESLIADLENKTILKTSDALHYSFRNPIYQTIILKEIDVDLKKELHHKLVNYLESIQYDSSVILYHKGHSHDPKASQFLYDLARSQKENNVFDESEKNYKTLLDRDDLDESLRRESSLDLAEVYLDKGFSKEAEEILNELINKIPKGEHQSLFYIKALGQLGVAYQQLEEKEKARDCFEKGLDILSTTKDFVWLNVFYKNRLGLIEISLSQIEKAEALFRESWDIWKNRLNEEEKLLAIRTDIDVFSYFKKDYQSAIYYLEEFIKVLSKRKHLNIYPIMIHKLGSAYLNNGDFEKAEKFLQEALDLMRQRKMIHRIYITHNELGRLYQLKGDFESSLLHLKHALDMAEKSNFSSYKYIIAFNIAKIHFKESEFQEAEKYFSFVLRSIHKTREKNELKDETQAFYHEFVSLTYLAELYRSLSDYDKSHDVLSQAFALMQDKNYLKSSEQLYWQRKASLEKKLSHQKEFDEAMSQLKNLKASSRHFNNDVYLKWIKSMENEFET